MLNKIDEFTIWKFLNHNKRNHIADLNGIEE